MYYVYGLHAGVYIHIYMFMYYSSLCFVKTGVLYILYMHVYRMTPNVQGTQFLQFGLPQFLQNFFVEVDPLDLLPDLFKHLLITVIILLSVILRCHSSTVS